MRTIKGDDYISRYDNVTNIIYGIYAPAVTTESTVALYAAITRLLLDVDIKIIRGIVMDFRRVERFPGGNLATVQRESHVLNRKFDLSHIPTALVVDTPLQEQIVGFTVKYTPDSHRKQLVYTIAEAYGYFDEWHQEHDAAV